MAVSIGIPSPCQCAPGPSSRQQGFATQQQKPLLCSLGRRTPCQQLVLHPAASSFVHALLEPHGTTGWLRRTQASMALARDTILDRSNEDVLQAGRTVLDRLRVALLRVAMTVTRTLAGLQSLLVLAFAFWRRRPAARAALASVSAARLPVRPAGGPAAAAATARTAAAGGLVAQPNAEVLGLVETLSDPNPSHDRRWREVEGALLQRGDVCGPSVAGLYEVTGTYSREVEQYREATGRQEPSGYEMWGLGSTRAVVEQEEALKAQVFRRLCEELSKQERTDEAKRRGGRAL